MESADGHAMGVPGELSIVANSQLTDKPITRYRIILPTYPNAIRGNPSSCQILWTIVLVTVIFIVNGNEMVFFIIIVSPWPILLNDFHHHADQFLSASVGHRIRQDYWQPPPLTRPWEFAWLQICPRKTDFFPVQYLPTFKYKSSSFD